jgi:hypothetical protein
MHCPIIHLNDKLLFNKYAFTAKTNECENQSWNEVAVTQSAGNKVFELPFKALGFSDGKNVGA